MRRNNVVCRNYALERVRALRHLNNQYLISILTCGIICALVFIVSCISGATHYQTYVREANLSLLDILLAFPTCMSSMELLIGELQCFSHYYETPYCHFDKIMIYVTFSPFIFWLKSTICAHDHTTGSCVFSLNHCIIMEFESVKNIYYHYCYIVCTEN